MRVAIVRHGEAQHNIAAVYNGNLQSPPSHLTEKGKQDALQASLFLQQHRMGVVDGCYVSQFPRTQETLTHMDVTSPWTKVTPLLNENLTGQAEGYTYQEMSAKYGVHDPWDHKAAHEAWGAESPESLLKRVRDFMAQLPQQGDYIVVTHGCVMGTMIQEWTGQHLKPPNGGVIILVLSEE